MTQTSYLCDLSPCATVVSSPRGCVATSRRAESEAVDLNPADALLALTPVVEALEQLGVPYHVGGSVASSSWGLPRASVDVDLVAELRADQVDRLVGLLEGSYFVQREPVLEAVQRRRSFNVIT